MNCPHCNAFDAAERAAIEGAEVPDHSIDPSGCTCAEREIAFTLLTPEHFFAASQVGLPIVQGWRSFAPWLMSPTATPLKNRKIAKKSAGAWCPCSLVGGVVRDGRGTFDVIAGDVDDCGRDGFDRTCRALGPYRGVVVTTCNATPGDVRHRFVLVLDRRMSWDEFPIVWRKMQRTLARANIVLDDSCSNGNRLYFAPVTMPDAIFAAHELTGRPLNVEQTLAAARRDEVRETAKKPPPLQRSPVQTRGTGYSQRALVHAARAVARAAKGERNESLYRETFTLARLADLRNDQIAESLGAAAADAGLDEREIASTIKSALRARRRSA